MAHEENGIRLLAHGQGLESSLTLPKEEVPRCPTGRAEVQSLGGHPAAVLAVGCDGTILLEGHHLAREKKLLFL